MRVKLIRLGSLITFCNGIYAIIHGLLILMFNKLIVAEYFRKIPVRWTVFLESFPYRAKIYFYLLAINSFLLISFGIFIIYLSYFILRRKDKLAWVILFLGGIIGWASLFIINIILGSWLEIILSFVGWGSFIVGMIIPIKYYLQKKYSVF